MNRIVRTVRMDELPPSLREEAIRGGLDPEAPVELTLMQTHEQRPSKSTDELLAMLRDLDSQEEHGLSLEEATERIRTLRDEWD